ncbi:MULTISPECIES: tyrosine-type recombinase/integrase [Actinotignum]|uniref:tyrosine-type recombinase/integrase n=1 Tax=Actinotignum TaxID=1653174 RepID=UPI00242C00AA|nr:MULTISPECIES: site-specific integrase [Actinotignum]MDY5128095.1 site-specific integrase [Actinotignum sp. SLA_B059]MDY5136392.1 site-specific integrase [Actinotignum sanguinis]MDY5138688.1 site-specific integrase [Actinotignum timonense]
MNKLEKWTVPAGWEEALCDWEKTQTLAGHRKSSRAYRIATLRSFARAVNKPPNDVTEKDVIDWASNKEISPETRHGYYIAVRAFFDWFSEGDNPAKVLRPVHRLRAAARPTPEAVYEDALDGAPPRTQLILRLAGEVGLRANEIAQIRKEHLGKDLLGYCLQVCGKGGKTRTVPLPTDIYLEMEERLIMTGTWLFPGSKEGHLSAAWVGRLARRELRDGWTLHTLRHRFATRAYIEGHDLMAVKDLLGHESVATTQRYVRSDAQAMRAAMLGARQERYKSFGPLPADTATPANTAMPATPAHIPGL